MFRTAQCAGTEGLCHSHIKQPFDRTCILYMFIAQVECAPGAIHNLRRHCSALGRDDAKSSSDHQAPDRDLVMTTPEGVVHMAAVQEETDEIISRDINRTFPEHPQFGYEQGQQALFRVLKAYSLHDLEVQYCQVPGSPSPSCTDDKPACCHRSPLREFHDAPVPGQTPSRLRSGLARCILARWMDESAACSPARAR